MRQRMYPPYENGYSQQRRALFGNNSSGNSGNGGIGATSNARSQEETHRIFEEDNNRLMADLESKATQLKSVTSQISSEVMEHNRLLSEMGTDMQQTEGLLGSTLRRLDTLLQSGTQSHMCKLILFVVFVFLAVYWLFIKP